MINKTKKINSSYIKLAFSIVLFLSIVFKPIINNNYKSNFETLQNPPPLSKKEIIEFFKNNHDLFNEVIKLAPNNVDVIPDLNLNKTSNNLSNSDKFEENSRIFVGIDKTNLKVVWHLFFSKLLKKRHIGYAGYIDFIVGIDEQGKITGIKILEHNETKTFVEGIHEKWFLEQFIGREIRQNFEPNVDFDSITHATVSINAFVKDLKEICNEASKILNNYIYDYTYNTAQQQSYLDQILNTNTNTITVFLSITFFIIFKKLNYPRIIYNIAILFLFGIITKQFMSLVTVVFMLQEPKIFIKSPSFVFALYSILFTFIYTKGYCFNLCPTGKLQEIICYIINRLCRANKHSNLPERHFEHSESTFIKEVYLNNYLDTNISDESKLYQNNSSNWFESDKDFQNLENRKFTKYRLGRILLVIGIVAYSLDNSFPLDQLEIFSTLYLLRTDILSIMFLLSSLIGSILVNMFYCKYLCPMRPIFDDIETLKKLFFKQIIRNNIPQTTMKNE